ncbi:hypothetical protein [Cecembia calidifontis]|jgi:hypothetical protein|uniref:Uncharacterized protein n=1 Tax=Cecembia calidifontis TaxID=1187080 RepID=A0A4Q7PCE3_9BACT|nr:hypothetical protein [Cecembia calidifontis]RZS98016.1 hypothetical protein BC751_3646 [Cecembia calidifontis]
MGINKNNIEIYCVDQLNNWVLKSQKSAIYETIFGIFAVGLFSILMFQKSNGNYLWFLLGVLGMMFYLGLYTYGGSVRRGRIINNTVKSLSFENNIMKIRTFSFNILGLKNLPEKVIEINSEKFEIKNCDYPIMDKKTFKDKVICVLHDNDETYYFHRQFFPNKIDEYFNK